MNAKKAARLVSLNAGKPGPLPYRGRTVRSGIVKTPAKHPLRLDHAGLEGDAQADLVGHGEPDRRACAYPVEHRPYWAERIGSPRSPEGRSGSGRDGEERNASGSLRGGRAARSPFARDGFLRGVLESWRRATAGRDEAKPWGNIRRAQPPLMT